MIALVALALGLTVGGMDFDLSFVRAKHYAKDDKARAFIDQTLLPKVGPQFSKIVGDCSNQLDLKSTVYEFTIVISYRHGVVDKILLDKETPIGRCVAEGLTQVDYPAQPPYLIWLRTWKSPWT